jgi:hypothetical protein
MKRLICGKRKQTKHRKVSADPYAGIIRTGSTGQSQIPKVEPPRQQKRYGNGLSRQKKSPKAELWGDGKGG